jgi:coenzyme F420 biosynthesis associated uncharacterized protein
VSGLIDWGLARTVAGRMAGSPPADQRIDPAFARAACEEALDRVLAYTGLQPSETVPEVELGSRSQWIDGSLETMAEMVEPLERAASDAVQLPWLLGAAARRGLGAATGLEVGAISGYASRKVLGQFDIALGKRRHPSRLLLVEPNVLSAAGELKVEVEPFLLWIAIHEQTHTAQFTSVPWLREHLSGLLDRLLTESGKGLDGKAIGALARRLLTTDPRESIQAALRGELMRALAGEEQQALMDELQAAMAVVEGYAEHVMDAAVAGEPELEPMRERLQARRDQRGGLADAIAKVLGLGMKMRQYELGKAFCDAVVSETGIAGLNRVWSDPAALPSLEQLENPQLWRAAEPASA